MPFQEFDIPVNPVLLVLIFIGIRWSYGHITGNKASSVGTLILWGMGGAIAVYALLLAVPWLAEKILPQKPPEKKP